MPTYEINDPVFQSQEYLIRFIEHKWKFRKNIDLGDNELYWLLKRCLKKYKCPNRLASYLNKKGQNITTQNQIDWLDKLIRIHSKLLRAYDKNKSDKDWTYMERLRVKLQKEI